MQVRLKFIFIFIAALIAGLLIAIPGTVGAQNADSSQNPSSDQGQVQGQAPAADEMQGQMPDQDQ